MNAARHITRIIARFIGSVSEVADAEGLKVTTVRESGKVTLTVTHPEGLTALSATFTSPPARSPKPTDGDGKQVTLEEIIQRKSATQGQEGAALPSPASTDDERPDVGDRVTLDGVAVEVLGVDAEGFIWRTVDAGERDEGDTAWSDARRVGPGVWETKLVEVLAETRADVCLYIPQTVWVRLEEHDPQAIEDLMHPIKGEPVVVMSTLTPGASARTLGPMTKEAASIVQKRANDNGVDVLDIDDLPARGKSWRESFDTMDSKRLDVTGACVVYGNHKDYRRKVRESGQTEESWLHAVAEVLTFPWVHVARLYSKTGVCLWDSRDGGAPKTCPPKSAKGAKGTPKLIPDATHATAMLPPKDETTRAAKGSRKLPRGAKGAR